MISIESYNKMNDISNIINEFNNNVNNFDKDFKYKNEEYNEYQNFLKNVFDSYNYFTKDALLKICGLSGSKKEDEYYSNFIFTNIFQIKYFLKKFNVWGNMNKDIQEFYETILKFYIKFNNIIHINEFKADKLQKLNNKWFYDEIELLQNQPFIYFDILETNELIYFYFNNDNELSRSKTFEGFTNAPLLFMSSAPQKYKSVAHLYKNYEFHKYFDNLIEFFTKIKELQ